MKTIQEQPNENQPNKENENLKNELENNKYEIVFLNEKIKKLKEKNTELKNENEELKMYVDKVNEDNEKLNKELIQAYKMKFMTSINETQRNLQENSKILNNLNEMIKMKDKEINDLKNQIQFGGNQNKKVVNYEDIMVVNFISSDQSLNCGISCLKDETFAEVEEKLYKQYGQYRETNNTFLFNGTTILRFKRISDNKIKNGDKIQLIPLE